ncbi:MAG: carbamoyltransferase HypF [Gemmatimonadaceae bacterium]
MAHAELYGGAGCPYTSELREQLLWEDRPFVEYDVETDQAALRRLISLTGGQRGIPVLVQDGRVVQVGWQGRACVVAPPAELPTTASPGEAPGATCAHAIRIRGIVQGVGFRPFVYRIAHEHGIAGWVLNDDDGVRIQAEGRSEAVAAFECALATAAPRAARIDTVDTADTAPVGCADFRIVASEPNSRPTAGITPDLPICGQCLTEILTPANRRAGYPYVNCTECGPRYSIVLALPYDRAATTMRDWAMCASCLAEYDAPSNRRFHAQPTACPQCGPHYELRRGEGTVTGDAAAIAAAAALLREGGIVAIKGLGGYHLACDADQPHVVRTLRERKFRKERPFALMVQDLDGARRTVLLSAECEALLTSIHRPIVLAPARTPLPDVAPGCHEIGVMLPYTPLHHLLFTSGAPSRLVMTSANRSSEPIAYRDGDAAARLIGMADALLVGARPIARRVDDSVARVGAAGPVVLRRSRGYAPAAVAHFPISRPLLAVGADLKNTVTLVVRGRAIVSQHIGDLEHIDARAAFHETIRDLTAMYAVGEDDVSVAHDLHPQYASTVHALGLSCRERHAVQHHRAHIASVLAEHGALDARVLGVAWDGTGFGDDGTIWGGEFFAGSVTEGLTRVGHLCAAWLPGGDAAARYPVQAAAGFLAEIGSDTLPELHEPPFNLPDRFRQARALTTRGTHCFRTTSVGRLFDAVAALLGFTRETTFEGQAAIWLEELARTAAPTAPLLFPFENAQLDFRPALRAIVAERARGRPPDSIARAFHGGLACGLAAGILTLCETHGLATVALSGGVFQNDLLLHEVLAALEPSHLTVWTNHVVPPNDGGISLGQAALVAGAMRA